MNIVAIISLVFAVAAFVYFIIRVNKIVKHHEPGQETYKIQGKERIELLVMAGITGLFLLVSSVCLADIFDWKLKFFEGFGLAFGPFLAGASLCIALGGFFFFYYKVDLDEKQKKVCKFAFPFGFLALFLGLFIFSEAIAQHISYPLVNGLSTGDGFTYPNKEFSGLSVKFYGILIVSGALLCYGITDHMMYQKYKKHGLIDTLFIVAFIFGILGARLWYCFVLEPEFFLANPGQILLGIVNGGLAVQGGALLGIIVGVSYMRIFRKYIDIRYIMDVAIPTILLAQAIGRWGNFFNQEVYGAATSVSNLWWLPSIVRNNMLIEGEYRIPLFYIESCMNIGGYFFIRYVLGKVCKLNCGLGFQASAYIALYGMTRVVLELFRDPEFRYMQSFITAFVMMGIGLAMAGAFFAVHKVRMNKGLEDKFGDKI